MTEKTLKDIRNALTEKTVDILAGYRKGFSVSHPPGQLVLPENLKEFSMYMLGLLKCRALKGKHPPPFAPSPHLTPSQPAPSPPIAAPTRCAC